VSPSTSTSIGTSIVSSIPSPSANSISIGPLSLNAYGLMIALGVIAAIWVLGRQLAAKGLGDAEDASSIGMWGVAAGIIGARLYHVATDFDRFSDDLGAIPKIWEGGLGIPGGLLAGVTVGIWQGRRRGIAPAQLLTCAAPAIPLAQAIGRFGNYFNQELYGRPTDLPWALEIDAAHLEPGYAIGTTFHPTFLYESLWSLGLCLLLLWIDRRFRPAPGQLMVMYVIGYGIGRFWVEGLRIDTADHLGGLRWNQWVALAAVVGGVIVLAIMRARQDSPVPIPVDGPDPDGDEVAATGEPGDRQDRGEHQGDHGDDRDAPVEKDERDVGEDHSVPSEVEAADQVEAADEANAADEVEVTDEVDAADEVRRTEGDLDLSEEGLAAWYRADAAGGDARGTEPDERETTARPEAEGDTR